MKLALLFLLTPAATAAQGGFLGGGADCSTADPIVWRSTFLMGEEAGSGFTGGSPDCACLAESGAGQSHVRCDADVVEGQSYLIQVGSLTDFAGWARAQVPAPNVADFCNEATMIRGEGTFVPDLRPPLRFQMTTELPSWPVVSTIDSGETFLFQLWYRDTDQGMPSSNLSDMLQVIFP